MEDLVGIPVTGPIASVLEHTGHCRLQLRRHSKLPYCPAGHAEGVCSPFLHQILVLEPDLVRDGSQDVSSIGLGKLMIDNHFHDRLSKVFLYLQIRKRKKRKKFLEKNKEKVEKIFETGRAKYRPQVALVTVKTQQRAGPPSIQKGAKTQKRAKKLFWCAGGAPPIHMESIWIHMESIWIQWNPYGSMMTHMVSMGFHMDHMSPHESTSQVLLE